MGMEANMKKVFSASFRPSLSAESKVKDKFYQRQAELFRRCIWLVSGLFAFSPPRLPSYISPALMQSWINEVIRFAVACRSSLVSYIPSTTREGDLLNRHKERQPRNLSRRRNRGLSWTCKWSAASSPHMFAARFDAEPFIARAAAIWSLRFINWVRKETNERRWRKRHWANYCHYYAYKQGWGLTETKLPGLRLDLALESSQPNLWITHQASAALFHPLLFTRRGAFLFPSPPSPAPLLVLGILIVFHVKAKHSRSRGVSCVLAAKALRAHGWNTFKAWQLRHPTEGTRWTK